MGERGRLGNHRDTMGGYMRVKRIPIKRYFNCDFETEVYEGQKDTRVWLAGYVQIRTPDIIKEDNFLLDEPHIQYDIDTFMSEISKFDGKNVFYFTNLKFDGSFILPWLLKNATPNYDVKENELFPGEFNSLISSMGSWYTITWKTGNGDIVEFRDLLKLIPLSVAGMGKAFNTKHRKTEMEYEGMREYGKVSENDINYFINDLMVPKEACEQMFLEGNMGLTIGSCCRTYYKRQVGYMRYNELFPNLYKCISPEDNLSCGEYIHKTYYGGWCYCNDRVEGKVVYNVHNYDVNSLYPSRMESDSGLYYPVYDPITFFHGSVPTQFENLKKYYYFIHIRCSFELKKRHLPFIHIIGNKLYRRTENLKTSRIKRKDGTYVDRYVDMDGNVKTNVVDLYLTCVDYKRFLDFYDVKNFEIISGIVFASISAEVFDCYIHEWRKVKENSTGGRRQIAKLFSNNFYGDFAKNTDSSYKIPYLKDDGVMSFVTIDENNKKPGYIAIGSAVTSYARDFTIRHAQENYDIFCYSDTDSIKTEGEASGLEIHDTKYGAWKLEGIASEAIFVRQKTYAEKIDGVTHITCAGMPDRCKELLECNIDGREYNGKIKGAKEFLSTKRTLSDIKVGLEVPGKLYPKRYPSGIVLEEGDFILREKERSFVK